MKIAAVALLFPSLALADREITVEPVCAEIEHADSLDDAGRAAAKVLLARTLEAEHQLVVEIGCAQTFRVGHHVAGGQLTIRITGPGGTRRWTNATADRLPEIYRDMVHALLAPAPVAPPVTVIESAEPLPPREVDSPPPAPFPVTAYPAPELPDEKRGGWHLHLGVGGAGGVGSGVTFEVGYRIASIDYAVDVFAAALGGSGGGSSKAGVEIFGLRKTDGSMLYGGGGFSAGQTSSNGSMFDGTLEQGSGLALEVTGGLGFGRMYLQADASLPFYQAGSAYPASFSLSLGVGRL